MKYLASAIVGIGLLGGTAHAASQPQVWQGSAFVKAVTPTCTSAGVAAVGDVYTVVYRPFIAGSTANNTNAGLTFIGGRNVLHYFTAEGQSFQTPGNASLVGDNSHASEVSGTTVAYSLKFTPATVSLASPQVYFTGSLAKFWGTTGCTVALTASLDQRID